MGARSPCARDKAGQDPLGFMNLGPVVLLKQLKAASCTPPPHISPGLGGICLPLHSTKSAGTRW